MKTLLAVSLILCAAVASHAQALPAAKIHEPFFTKRVLFGIAVIGAAVAADCTLSARTLEHTGVELNPLMGRHPSAGRMAGVCVGATGFWTALHLGSHALMRHDPNKVLRFLGDVNIPAEAATIHGIGAAQAAHVCSVSSVCR